MIKSYHLHKRNTSECFASSKPKIYSDKQAKRKSLHKNKSKTLSLIEKSARKIPHKLTVVDTINQDNSNTFFAFGRRESAAKNWSVGLDKILEVQDSKREVTSQRSQREFYPCAADKENYDLSNFQNSRLRKSGKSQTKSNKSKSKKNKNEKTRSTISLSRVKNGTRELQMRTEKIEKSMKMLWECMGELWESSRVSQYRSEKNSESLNSYKRRLEEQEEKILEIKFEMGRHEPRGNLRA